METTLKKCYSCKSMKELLHFNKNKTKIDGYSTECKVCIREYDLKYRRSKTGLISQIYSHQKSKSKKRNHPSPTYTKQELKEWLFSQELFHKLFEEWELSNYDMNLTPSVDRKNDYIGYTINNIQIMTCKKNTIKGGIDRFNGINRKPLKAVIQLTKDNKIVREFYSIAKAFRETNINQISAVCLGKRKTAGGFKWKFKEE